MKSAKSIHKQVWIAQYIQQIQGSEANCAHLDTNHILAHTFSHDILSIVS